MGEVLVRIAAVLLGLALAAPAAAADEVPFVVSPDTVTLAMLQAARVGNEDYLIDLGSGDGRIVILAAKRFGARGLGIEINPELVAKSRANARNAGVESRVSFREQDLFKTDLSPDRKSTRLNSSHSQISYAVFCLKKKKSRLVLEPWRD